MGIDLMLRPACFYLQELKEVLEERRADGQQENQAGRRGLVLQGSAEFVFGFISAIKISNKRKKKGDKGSTHY